MTGSSPHPDTLAVTNVVERYRQGFLSLDAPALATLWDLDHTPLIYVAQEASQPISGAEAIRNYYSGLGTHLDGIDAMAIDDVVIDVAGDTALAFFGFTVRARLKGQDRVHDPSGRVTMILRRTDGGDWRIVHYHESALAHHAAQAGAD